MTSKLSHFDDQGAAHMVDISDKAVTSRIATAKGRIIMAPETLAMITKGTAKKGDVLGVARVAGIMAAKKTPDLIPLCHPLPITKVAIDLTVNKAKNSVDIEATIKTT
ncbi:MAG: cyclic pyranopterin monophosphate synthase MoaC, partial [Amylibacter sp.]